MKKTLLISDLDSVLCQTTLRALRWVWDRYRVVVPPSAVRRYDMEFAVAEHLQRAGILIDSCAVDAELTRCCWTNPAFFRELEPRSEIWAALHRWQRVGLPLQFQTRRIELLRNVTESWLGDHGLDLSTPLASGQRNLEMAAEKAELTREACEHYERVIFLEDAPFYAAEIAKQSAAEVWVVRQPWNQTPLAGCERPSDAEIGSRLRDLARCHELAA